MDKNIILNSRKKNIAPKNMRILLVEDDPDDVFLLKGMLNRVEGQKFKVTVAESINACRNQLRTDLYDVLLLDLSLSDSQGLSTLAIVKQGAVGIPIIVLTGLQDEKIATEAVRKGAQDYLVKGKVNADVLLRSLSYAVERNQLNREMCASEERLRTIIENTSGGILIISKSGIVEFANRAAEELFGRTKAKLEGRDFGYPITRGGSDEIDIIKPDKEHVSAEMQIVELDWQGEDAYLVLLHDISERKRNEKMKDEFVGNVSHELRTPLTIIRESISQIADGLCGAINDKQKKYLGKSLRNIDRLKIIIDNLLDISKIESGKVEVFKESFNLIEVVDEIFSDFEPHVRQKNLEFKKNYSANVVMVYADKPKIIQVFTNLVGNALKFTSEGYIEMVVLETEDTIECVIKDTGKGISKNDYGKLFSKFEQLGRLNGPGEKGTGLGLCICKSIIDMHKGSINVNSEVGEGTEFKISLPKSVNKIIISAEFQDYLNDLIQKSEVFVIVRVQIGSCDSGRLPTVLHEMGQDVMRLLHRADDLVFMEKDSLYIVLPNTPKGKSDIVISRLSIGVNARLNSSEIYRKMTSKIQSVSYPDEGVISEDLITKLMSVKEDV